MGTWSTEPFGNDSACDWAYELEGAKDFAHVEAAIDSVLAVGSGYLDAEQAVEAVAAAEVLAKSLGRGTQADAYTETVDAWIADLRLIPGAELLAKARHALARIDANGSELRELWEESGDFPRWEASLKALSAVLAPAAA